MVFLLCEILHYYDFLFEENNIWLQYTIFWRKNRQKKDIMFQFC
jgi:hypothetical protein